MKVSLNWAQFYSNVDLKKIGKERLLDKIGAQLGAVEGVEEWGPRYKGGLIVKVVSCTPHPNADKLHICKIDDGGITKHTNRDTAGHIQVVCGAPNVHAGMFAAWLPPGMTVPSTIDKDPLILDVREIRGERSYGMLASPRELGLSDDHSGIADIQPEDVGRDPQTGNLKQPRAGDPLASYFGLDDLVIDIENKMFTHRPDCFGLLGVARELAGIQHQAFKSPEWYLNPNSEFRIQNSEFRSLPLSVKNEIPKLVPRFMAVAMKNVRAGPSPYWLQAGLTRVAIRPVNSVVDITNFLMYLTGQPMHAYDADKLKAKSSKQKTLSLEARLARKGERLKLLSGKEVSFDDDSAILISSHGVPVGLGGVIGGSDTEVDEATKNIVLEAATFDMYNIRHTAMKYGLFTDAVTRFIKGQSPLQNDRAMVYAMQNVVEMTGGLPASRVHDVKSRGLKEPESVAITADFVNARLGAKLSVNDIAKLLENVEFKTVMAPADKKRLHVRPPFWRTDIEIPEDVVEEAGRLYGYDHLPRELPKRDLTPAAKNPAIELKTYIREKLAAAGANEILTYSFVHGDLLKKVGQDHRLAFQLSNALSPDLQYYRLTVTPSLLEKVHPNVKAGFDQFAIFEIGKIHLKGAQDPKEAGLPQEDTHIALVFAAEPKTAQQKYAGAAFYQAVKYLKEVLPGAGSQLVPLSDFKFGNDTWAKQMVAPYEPKRSAVIVKDEVAWGVVGEFKPSVKAALKLPDFAAGFEVAVELIDAKGKAYQPLPRFPKVEQDISLKVPSSLPYQKLFQVVHSELTNLAPPRTAFSLQPIDIYQRQDDPKHKQVTLRLSIASFERTLLAEEINQLLDKLAATAKQKLGAVRL